MNYLLDTHAWIWFVEGSGRIPPDVVRRIDAADATVWVSAVSAFEVTLLAERGRIQLSTPAGDWVVSAMTRGGLREAPLDMEIAMASRRLSVPTEDPIDRFVAATALVRGWTLVTADRALRVLPGAKVLAFSARGSG